jgi:hypothetical protein
MELNYRLLFLTLRHAPNFYFRSLQLLGALVAHNSPR